MLAGTCRGYFRAASPRRYSCPYNHKLTSVCPFWLKLEGKEFSIIRDRAQLVYQMCLDGHGPMSIAQQLNKEGVPTWTTQDERKELLQRVNATVAAEQIQS